LAGGIALALALALLKGLTERRLRYAETLSHWP